MTAALLLAAGLLLDAGTSSHAVVLPEPCAPEIEYAAAEFTSAVGRVSGVALPVVRGAAVSPCVRLEIEGDAASADERLAYRVDGRDLVIAGNQPRAVLHATYAFLQRELGVRWYYPDKEGEIFPACRRFELRPGLSYDYMPPIRYRGYHTCGDQYRRSPDFLAFAARNFANIHRRGVRENERKFGFWNMRSTHGAHLGANRELFAAHPEYYAELHGKRSKTNICLSSDGAVEEVVKKLEATYLAEGELDILSFFLFDNPDYCQCAKCRMQSVSENWFRFYGKCVKRLRERHPKLKFATIAYQGYRDVPSCEIADTEFVEFTTHGRCNHHSYLKDPCEGTAKDLDWMRAWAKKGVPTGQYTYEYDAYLRNGRYLPYFSLIDDVVNVAAELKHRVIIPEIGMSPRNGPDVNVGWLQNRLTIAWYAQKMFDPSLAWRPWLKEATGLLFGPAGDDLYRYFDAFETAWTGQKTHLTILGDSISGADRLLTDETVRVLSGALEDAERKLASFAGPEKGRYVANLRREQALWWQWLDSLAQKKGLASTVRVPMIARAEDAKSVCSWITDPGRRGTRTARTLVLKTSADKLRALTLGPSDSGASYSFTRTGAGKWTSSATSEVGVTDDAWTCAVGESGSVLTIDLTAFSRRPAVDEVWNLTVVSAAGAKKMLPVRFTTLDAVDRPVAWWMGKPERDARRIPTWRAAAADLGYAVTFCTNAADFVAASGKAENVYIHNPGKPFTAACGAAARMALERGATVYVCGFNGFRLENVLGDSQLRSEPSPAAAGAHGQRRSTFVHEGAWRKTPWDIEMRLKYSVTPAYAQVGVGEGWTVLATLKGRDGADTPYLSCRKVGKGLLILSGAEMAIEPLRIIDNVSRQFNP